MATQPLSEAGAIYSTGGQPAVGPSRLTSLAISAVATGGVLRGVAARPVSAAVATYVPAGLAAISPERPLSRALTFYVPGGLQSLQTLRLLSRPFVSYVTASLPRVVALRPMRPGYLLEIPIPPPPPEPPPVDTTPPDVSNYSPPIGTPITKTTSISFDVTEETGAFRRILVVAFFPATGVSEVIHDGDGFRGFYAATSARQAIAGGFRYTVLRRGGWPAAPTIQTFAIDLAGNEAN